jgi:hypothetical protein
MSLTAFGTLTALISPEHSAAAAATGEELAMLRCTLDGESSSPEFNFIE